MFSYHNSQNLLRIHCNDTPGYSDICYLINVDTKGQLLDCVMDRDSRFKNIEEYTLYSLKHELNNIIRNHLNTQENCRECVINQKGKDIRCSGFCKFSHTFIRQQVREKD